eukprot:42990-Eustigmatos_ZCMA.PRE.1
MKSMSASVHHPSRGTSLTPKPVELCQCTQQQTRVDFLASKAWMTTLFSTSAFQRNRGREEIKPVPRHSVHVDTSRRDHHDATTGTSRPAQ